MNRIAASSGKATKGLKQPTEADTPLTTYVPWPFFATVLKQSGVLTVPISGMMGHNSEATTRIYLKGFDNEVLAVASQALL